MGVGDFIQHPIDTGENALNKVRDNFNGPGGGFGGLAKGVALGLAQIPVTIEKTLTGLTVGSDGSVVPSSPEEDAKNVQSTLALIATGGIASKVSKLLGPTSSELLGIKSVTAPGNLIKSVYSPRIMTGMIAGGTYGGISNIGQEDQLASTISTALAGATLGALIRPSKAANSLTKLIQPVRAKVDAANLSNAQDIAATRGLQITPEDSPLSMSAKVKAFAVGNSAIDAFINTNLTMGKQTILEDIPEDVVKQLTAKYNPSLRSSEGPYTPTSETQAKLDNHNFKLSGDKKTIVDITDPFDKATIAGENDPAIHQEIKDQTGLKQDEINSHKEYVKDQIYSMAMDKNNLTPPDPNVVAQNRVNAIQKGYGLLNTATDGSNVIDGTGKKWIKSGRYITDGSTQLPINDTTAELIGTDKSLNPTANTLRIPKQTFSPEFGREMQGGITIYKGASNTTLISSYRLAPDVETFFKNSGYLPGEMVTGPDGSAYSIVEPLGEGKVQTRVRSIATGETTPMFNQFIRRLPNGIDSEFYKASNGEALTRQGVYNKENFYDNVYNKFIDTHFKLDEVPKEPFGGLVYKFAKSIGMTNVDDIDDMSSAFFSRIVNDVVGKMEPDVQDRYARAVETMNKWNKDTQASVARSLHQALSQNNMSLYPRGGGVYDIKDVASGEILNSTPINNLEDALKFVNKSRQAVAYDLDGGQSNGLPVVGGSMLDTYVPYSNKVADWIDTKFNAGAAATTLVRTRSAINAMDRVAGTAFTPFRVALDHGQNIVHNFISNPQFRKMNDSFNDAIKLGKDMPLERKALVYNDLTTHSPQELINRFAIDQQTQNIAKQIATVGSNKVVDFINEVRENSNYNPTNSQSFKNNLAQVTKSGRYEQKIIDVGTNWLTGLDGTSKPALALRLAQSIEAGYMPKSGLNPAENSYKSSLQKAHDNFPGVTDSFWTYLPHAKLAQLAGYNPFIGHSADLIKAFSRISSTPSGQSELDPSTVLYNLRSSMIKSAKIIDESRAFPVDGVEGNKISMNDIVKRSQDYINSLNAKDADDDITTQNKKQNAPYQSFFQNYLDDVKGVPDLTKQMGDRAELALKEMYGPKYQKMPEFTRLASSVVYSSLLGLRPAFALRDIWNAHQNVFIFAGPEAALKSFGGIFSREQAKLLMEQGEIPATKGADMLNPGENIIDGMSRLSKVQVAADNLSNWATKLNGQQLAHVQANTGIYNYYWNKVGELSRAMLKDEKSKADAYTELKLQKISPTEQKMFDDMIKVGRTDQAGRFLARTMVDRFNVEYGRNNAPQSWKSWFGKLAGGFGQWATNQINTNIDHLTRGTGRQIAESWARMAISNAAIYGVGAVTGLNLARWMINPAMLPGESPLLSGLLGVHQDAENVTNLDPAIANPAGSKLMKQLPYPGNWAHLYLPFSYFVQNELDSYDMLQGDFGPSAIAKGLTGISTVNATVSPLQQQMGLRPEWKDRIVPDKGIGNQAIGNMLLEGRSILP
jgi:hypothetical protein